MYPILLLLYFPMFSLTTNVKMKVLAILSRDMRKKCCNILHRLNTMRVVCIQALEYIIILNLFWSLKRNAAIHDKTPGLLQERAFLT